MNKVLDVKPQPIRTITPSVITMVIIYGILLLIYITVIVQTIEIFEIIKLQIGIDMNIVLGVILILIFINSIIRLIIKFLKIKNTNFQISKDFVSYSQEFISINRLSIPTSQITNIDSYVSFFWDKIFKTGTLNVYTSGSSSVDLVLYDIKNVEELYKEIQTNTQKKDKGRNDINNNNNNNESNTQTLTKKNASSKSLLSIKPNVKIATISTLLPLIPVGFFLLLSSLGTLFPIFVFILEADFLLTFVAFIALLILVSILALTPFYTYKYYSNISYYFYEDSIEYFDGFFNVQKHTIPYKRITNSNSFQSLLDRILGVYTITIETAGSFQSQIKIKYVNNGEEINNKILEILQQHGDN